MQPYAFEEVLDRAHENDAFSDVIVYVKENGKDESGEMTYVRTRKDSDVVKKIYTLNKKSPTNKYDYELHIIHTGGYVTYVEPGEEIEIIATSRSAHPVAFFVVKPGLPKTSPDHRVAMTFQRVAEIHIRALK